MNPQAIGRYQIITMLGKGGMATVYQAFDPQFQREVAIKVLPPEFLHDDTFRARFTQEAQAVATLEHSAIVPVYDFGEHEGLPYLVMRYMGGGSLADRLDEGPIPVSEAARIVERIAAALDSAHKRGVIHRDVKPANILFDRHGDAYLSDFGILKITESTARLTGSGIVGTPSYMAPEMSQEGIVSPQVDVYALGVTLYEMLTGSAPYKATTPVALLLAHVQQPIPSARALRPDLPPSVEYVIQQAMAKRPEARFQSAGELARALTTAAQGGYITPPPPTVHDLPATIYTTPAPPLPAEPFPKRRPWLALVLGGVGAMILLACVLVGAVLIFGGGLELPATKTEEPDRESEQEEEEEPTQEVEGPDAPPTDAPPTSLPTPIPPTPTKIPTAVPSPTPGPNISNIRFCNSPCLEPGSAIQDSFAEGVKEIWVAWDYRGMRRGASYTREWTNQGQVWVHYECVWQGSESGTWSLRLYDLNGGLRSGEWVLTITVEGRIVAQASVRVEGNNSYWDPAGRLACPDW